jgi:hypothetical protein
MRFAVADVPARVGGRLVSGAEVDMPGDDPVDPGAVA